MKVGTVVKSKVDLWALEVKKGDIGLCYVTYSIGNRDGQSIIFENGNYDGFSDKEVEEFLNTVGEVDMPYRFQNVMCLSQDYKNNYFTKYFEKAKAKSQ